MLDSRGKKAKINIIVSFGCQIVTLLCGFVVPRLMIGAFGSEAYGATSSITQFLSYITLLEGGIGGVARAALYKPLAENNMEVVSAVIDEIKRFFRVIAYIFIIYVFVIACSFKTISNVESLDWITTFGLVIVISISTFGQYFIGAANATLLQASQKTYITNIVSISATVLNTIFVVILVKLGFNLITVKLVSSCIFFMRPVVLWLYVKKHYELVRGTKSKEHYLTQKWSGLGQHIAFFLHSNTDVVVLTCFANLSMVAVYSVYNMIISHIQNLTTSFVTGMEALFGDMLAKEEYEQLHRSFGYYETIISTITVILFSATAVLIVPFIKIYTAGITDADYIAPTFAVLLIMSAVLYCLRMPYHSVIIAAGHFKQTSLAAYGEAVINIILSILLVRRYGIIGVAIGTVIATGFRFAYYVVYLSKNIFKRKLSLFFRRLCVNAFSFFFILVLGSFGISKLLILNYAYWAVCGVVVVMIAGFITLGANYIFYQSDYVTLFGMFRRKKKVS